MKPSDLNLPGSFTSYRDGQLETAIALSDSTKRFRLLSAPPGRGKSLINMTVARLRESDGRTLILTGTKSLQSQMVADFQAAGLAEVKGLSNYRCVAVDRHLQGFAPGGSTCDVGPCRAGVYCNYREEGGCLYYDAQAQAAEALVVVTNYAYWMALGRSGETSGLLGEFDTIILDECHTAPGWLTNFCSVSLDKDEINDLLGLSLPPINEGVAVWSEWAEHARSVAGSVLSASKTALENSAALKGADRSRLVKRILRLRDIERGLGELAAAGRWKRGEGTRRETRMPGMHTDWVAEKYETRAERGVRFTPVWPHNYAEQYIYRGIPNVVLTSGTMTKDIMQYMGISPSKAEYTELDSSFDAARHPTYIIPKVRVDRNNGEGEKRQLVSAIDHIIGARMDRKGLIHARSYDRAKDIIRLSKHSSIMMSHSTGGLPAAVGKFKKSDAPCVLVSPSATEGIDLPYDDCRYIIIVKVPFLDGRSELVKARSATDRNYVNYEAALAMVQMAGRGMRAEDDQMECFILDAHMEWFMERAKWPRWFMRTWKRVNSYPPPLRLEAL